MRHALLCIRCANPGRTLRWSAGSGVPVHRGTRRCEGRKLPADVVSCSNSTLRAGRRPRARAVARGARRLHMSSLRCRIRLLQPKVACLPSAVRAVARGARRLRMSSIARPAARGGVAQLRRARSRVAGAAGAAATRPAAGASRGRRPKRTAPAPPDRAQGRGTESGAAQALELTAVDTRKGRLSVARITARVHRLCECRESLFR